MLDTSAGWIVHYLRLFVRRGGDRNGELAVRSGRRSGACRHMPDHEILKGGLPLGVNERGTLLQTCIRNVDLNEVDYAPFLGGSPKVESRGYRTESPGPEHHLRRA